MTEKLKTTKNCQIDSSTKIRIDELVQPELREWFEKELKEAEARGYEKGKKETVESLLPKSRQTKT